MRFAIIMAALLISFMLTDFADAIGRRRRARRNYYTPTTYYNAGWYQFTGNPAEVAQQRANKMAELGYWAHFGGSYGGATGEGVGSGMSPAAALGNCCNWGAPLAAEATAQGANGVWYGCRLYW